MKLLKYAPRCERNGKETDRQFNVASRYDSHTPIYQSNSANTWNVTFREQHLDSDSVTCAGVSLGERFAHIAKVCVMVVNIVRGSIPRSCGRNVVE